MSEGMAGMVHANDVRIAEGLATSNCRPTRSWPWPPGTARLNDAVVRWHRQRAADIPDLNDLEARAQRAHGLLLPALLRPAHVQQRLLLPLPPARSGRDPDGDLVAHPIPRGQRAAESPRHPSRWECDDPRWPPIPAQDFSNLPRQQKGLHARGFEYMRLSERAEGHISNFERTIDGFLAGLPYERLLPALRGRST
jgi:hypothetical protein